jgi:hypothetical protein
MPNNTGVIFGRVTRGGPLKDVELDLNWIVGEGQVRVGGSDDLKSYTPKVKSNKEGRYALPFFWEAADIGKLGMGFGTASVLAMEWLAGGSYVAKNTRGKAFLCLDIKKLIAYGFSPVPNSLPDATNIAKDFYVSYKDMLPKAYQGQKGLSLYPTTPILSTEVFGLIANIDIAMP